YCRSLSSGRKIRSREEPEDHFAQVHMSKTSSCLPSHALSLRAAAPEPCWRRTRARLSAAKPARSHQPYRKKDPRLTDSDSARPSDSYCPVSLPPVWAMEKPRFFYHRRSVLFLRQPRFRPISK